MTSTKNTKLYKINKRPKDALSDDEDIENEYKNDDSQSPSNPQKSQNSMSILLWFEQNVPHYVGFLGQQSYSFATTDDIIVAYNYANMDKDWYLWLLNINKFSPTQFLWVQGENCPKATDIEKDEYFVKQISMIIDQKLTDNPSLQIYLKIFWMQQATENVINMIKSNISKNELKNNIVTYCASTEWAEKFGNKACLHRYISTPDKPSLFEECNVYSQVDGLSECKGYVATNKDELLRSYDKLTKEIGRTRVVIKDCFGVSGDDITFYKSKQEIIDNFEWKNEFKFMAMEEDLRYNDHEIEKVQFIGCQFYDNEVMGTADQIIHNDAIYTGSMTFTDKEMESELKKITAGVMKKIGTKWMGGFDFAIQRFKDTKVKPKVYLIDMNTCRYTAPMQAFIVQKRFGADDKYFIRKNLKIKKNASFKEIMKENSDILFNVETKRGVYFHMFGVTCGEAIASIFGNDEKDANDILNKLKSIKSLCQ